MGTSVFWELTCDYEVGTSVFWYEVGTSVFWYEVGTSVFWELTCDWLITSPKGVRMEISASSKGPFSCKGFNLSLVLLSLSLASWVTLYYSFSHEHFQLSHLIFFFYIFYITGEIVKCTFDNGACDIQNRFGNNFDWSLRTGSTPTSGTGPSKDHTPNILPILTGTGKHLCLSFLRPVQNRLFKTVCWSKRMKNKLIIFFLLCLSNARIKR